nr:chitinase [Apis mellifera nudivirus]
MINYSSSSCYNTEMIVVLAVVALLFAIVAFVVLKKPKTGSDGGNNGDNNGGNNGGDGSGGDDGEEDETVDNEDIDRDDPDNEFDNFKAKMELPTRVVGYYTNWSRYRKDAGFLPETMPTQYITDIVYAFFPINDNGEVRYSDAWADLGLKGIANVVKLRGQGAVKRILFSIGGWTYSGPDTRKTFENEKDTDGTENDKPFQQIWDELLKTPQSRKRFIDSAIAMMNRHDFDGIDIDYEYPVCPQGMCDTTRYKHQAINFINLLQELRAAIGSGKFITLATAASDINLATGPNMKRVTEIVDYINVMTYDYFVYGAGAKSGHNQPKHAPTKKQSAIRDLDTKILNVNHTLWRYMKYGCDPKKLNIGVALYGRGYTLSATDFSNAIKTGKFSGYKSTGPSHTTRWTQERSVASSYEYATEFADARSYYVPGEGSWLANEPTLEILSYTDAFDLWALNNIRRRKGIGGVLFYAADQDDYLGSAGQGKFPIIRQTLSLEKPVRNLFGKPQ